MTDKAGAYALLLKQLAELVRGETNETSVLANVAAAIHQASDRFFWTGFYMQQESGQPLRLGPFQGPPACYDIPVGRGVCGTAFAERRTLVVPDVELFPGHIACSSLSRSEIVVPVFRPGGEPVGVLDIDSRTPCAFDETDTRCLEEAMRLMAAEIYAG